jgi:hypothetical protein
VFENYGMSKYKCWLFMKVKILNLKKHEKKIETVFSLPKKTLSDREKIAHLSKIYFGSICL